MIELFGTRQLTTSLMKTPTFQTQYIQVYGDKRNSTQFMVFLKSAKASGKFEATTFQT